MTLVRRGNRKAAGPFVRRRRRAAADHRGGAHPRRGHGHRGGRRRPRRRAARRRPLCGVLLQYPGASGRILDPRAVIEAAHDRDALVVVAADLLALTLLEAPGALGADVVVGSSQRFGVPLFYGGPHAGYMAVAAGLERHLPGSAGRRLGRRRGPTGLPPGAADPRAAHPPRQGDLQHLHGAGAAGRRRLDVRRLPRSRGAQAIAARTHDLAARAAASLAARGPRGAAPTRSSTPSGPVARPRGRGRRRGPR